MICNTADFTPPEFPILTHVISIFMSFIEISFVFPPPPQNALAVIFAAYPDASYAASSLPHHSTVRGPFLDCP